VNNMIDWELACCATRPSMLSGCEYTPFISLKTTPEIKCDANKKIQSGHESSKTQKDKTNQRKGNGPTIANLGEMRC